MSLTVNPGKPFNAERFSGSRAWNLNNTEPRNRTGLLDSIFPPAVRAAMSVDENFAVGIDPKSGNQYLIINPSHGPDGRGTKFNIYV